MDTEMQVRVLVGALLASMMFVSGRYRHRANKVGGGLSPLEDGLAFTLVLRVGGLIAWGIVLGYVFGTDSILAARAELPTWLRASGIGLMLTALPLGIWVLRSLGNNITATSAASDDAELVTYGPYRYVRHPLYAVGSLLWLGMALATSNWLVWLGFAVPAVGLALRTPREEARLLERFGSEYAAYMARTPRLIPRPLRN